MKRTLRTAALTAILLGSAFGLSWAGATPGVEAYYEYGSTPIYLDNNPDYIAAYGQRDDLFFVDTSSVVIVKQENQFYEIAANLVQYRPRTGELISTSTKYILFDTQKGYIYIVGNDTGEVDFDHPLYTHAHTAEYGLRTLAMARLMWHKATGGYWNY